MREYTKIPLQVLTAVVCNRCKKRIDDTNIAEWQEMFIWENTGGYGSVFGDCVSYECDLCQHCLKEVLGPYLRLKVEEEK